MLLSRSPVILASGMSDLIATKYLISMRHFTDKIYVWQVFIHNPHVRGVRRGRMELGAENDISLLNINQSVSAIATGKLKADAKQDTLVVGTQTNLLAYNVMDNSDLFYKDVSNY